MIKMAIINKDQVEMSIDFSNDSQNIDFLTVIELSMHHRPYQ